MTADRFEYDVALSFAGEDRALAEELARLLEKRAIHVLRDEFEGGMDMIDHLVNLYSRKARYCVLLVSHHYPLTAWTEAERMSARERALRDAEEYIVPVQLEDVEVPGMAQAKGYRDLRKDSMKALAGWLEEKLRQRKDASGPPPESHDLRSGNVPS